MALSTVDEMKLTHFMTVTWCEVGRCGKYAISTDMLKNWVSKPSGWPWQILEAQYKLGYVLTWGVNKVNRLGSSKWYPQGYIVAERYVKPIS